MAPETVINPATGRASNAVFYPSSNANQRPDGIVIDAIIIHSISLPPGQFGGSWVRDLFCNQLDASLDAYFFEICGLQVSSHFLIHRDGRLSQFVPTNQRAWHAGRSSLLGRDNVNDFSIGIELEGDDYSPFNEPQYDTLNSLVAALVNEYSGINADRIVGHSDVAPGRKTDPGPYFDWSRIEFKAKKTRPI